MHWLPQPDQPSLEIFRLDEHGQQVMPEGIPVIVNTDFNKKNNLESVKSNVTRMKNFLAYGQWCWWEDFFQDPQAQIPAADPWYMTQYEPQEASNPNPSEQPIVVSPLASLMQPERNLVQHVSTTIMV